MDELDLAHVPPVLHDIARQEFEAGDAVGILGLASNEYGLNIVENNIDAFKKRGIYEAALLHAFTGTRTNNSRWRVNSISFLFAIADPQKLLDAGRPLPDGDTFIAYRGVAGEGRRRRIRTGYSWTLNRSTACWFAVRLPSLKNPAVYQVEIDRGEILAFCNDRTEQEIICCPRQKPRRVSLTVEQMAEEAKHAFQ